MRSRAPVQSSSMTCAHSRNCSPTTTRRKADLSESVMPADPKDTTLILIPAYNAESHLTELIRRVRAHLDNQHLLIVNDGSTDRTADLLEELSVRYLSFPHNRGKGAALHAGFRYAIDHGYRSVLTMDADLQHLPEELPKFLSRENGRCLLLGTRTIDRSAMPLPRQLSNNLTSLIVSIFSTQRIRDSQSGFRLIPAALLRATRLTASRYDFESQLLFQAGVLRVPVEEVPITTVYDGAPSHISPLADIGRFIRQVWRRIWL
ncbi:glycosyltransferase [candidate division GN15 bacterium]|nr:glycosyltransferase [candidate division GN15 bacterium]